MCWETRTKKQFAVKLLPFFLPSPDYSLLLTKTKRGGRGGAKLRSKKGQFPGLPSFSFFRSFACRPPTTEAKKRFSSLLLVFLLLTVCMGLGRAGSLLPSPPSFSLSSLPITQLCPQRGEQKMSLKMSGGHDNGRPPSFPRSEGERERGPTH